MATHGVQDTFRTTPNARVYTTSSRSRCYTTPDHDCFSPLQMMTTRTVAETRAAGAALCAWCAVRLAASAAPAPDQSSREVHEFDTSFLEDFRAEIHALCAESKDKFSRPKAWSSQVCCSGARLQGATTSPRPCAPAGAAGSGRRSSRDRVLWRRTRIQSAGMASSDSIRRSGILHPRLCRPLPCKLVSIVL